MKTVIINGLYLTERLTGVQRFACEIISQLSKYNEISIQILLPPRAKVINEFPKNIQIIRYGKLNGRLWEQISLPKYCKRQKLPLLCMGNIAPLFLKNSILILHDVIFREKSVYSVWSWRIKTRLLTRAVIYRQRMILTVSEFSKARIIHYYPKLKHEPVVLCNGWEHMISLDSEQVKKIPQEFYLSVGSKNPNKNFQYVLKLAQNNPDKQFVITGLSKNDVSYDTNVKNCYFTGYLNNKQLKWLYSHCKGFILPSFYEGFGIPPLEAVACGCRSLYLSDIEPFREIYGDCAIFFNQYDYDNTVVLSDYIMTEEKAMALLKKYSWRHAAEQLYAALVKLNS